MNSAPPVVILAAGSSSRLGQPKQLLTYGGESLLGYTIRLAREASLGEVYVVLGARETEVQKVAKEVIIISNKKWEEGLASSIVAGVSWVKEKAAEGLVLLLCDQPFVTAELIKRVAKAGEESGMAVCDYGEEKGPPAYFAREYFDELLTLKGDAGAKEVVKKNSEKVRYISFPKGIHDIDREEDLKLLKL